MQPKTNVKFDTEAFKRINKTIRNMSLAKRLILNGGCLKLPTDIGLQLTNRCNLRCTHCFQWNERGHHQKMTEEDQNAELPFIIVEKVLTETKKVRSGLFLWGGEPMFYSSWDDLTILLEHDPRWTINCTNGILVEQKLDSLLRCSKTLVMLISVEGLHEDNDILRGRNTFKHVMKGIDLLLELQRLGIFLGKISINCTIHEGNITKLYEIVKFFEERGVDSIYLNFPWYIPKAVAERMDEYFNEHFSYLETIGHNERNSWHCYTFHIDKQKVDLLEDEIRRVSTRKWNIRVRLQPALEQSEIRDFVIGERMTMDSRKYCLGIYNRMDVLTSGRVSICKHFPEFQLESLETNSVAEIWSGHGFERFREIHHKNGLMPVCSKCIVLHLHGR